MAAQNGHLECVKLLLQYNARVNSEEMTSVNRIGKSYSCEQLEYNSNSVTFASINFRKFYTDLFKRF